VNDDKKILSTAFQLNNDDDDDGMTMISESFHRSNFMMSLHICRFFGEHVKKSSPFQQQQLDSDSTLTRE
jgi:hypothetical protein